MKITSITAGAGGMYCGSCIRDNALAAALTRRGHEVTLLPLYTPTRTDEENVSRKHVFFSGVSVYLEQHVPLFRRTPWLLDRLWESPRLLRFLSGRMQTDPGQLGGLTVSMLEGTHGRQRKEFDKLVHWLRGQPRPDVVDISNSMLIGVAEPLRRALGCPVNCTLQGEDVFLDGLPEPHRSRALALIREQAAHVDSFVAVSDYYAERMSRYLAIPGARMHVVPLGVDIDRFRPAPDSSAGPPGPDSSAGPLTIGTGDAVQSGDNIVGPDSSAGPLTTGTGDAVQSGDHIVGPDSSAGPLTIGYLGRIAPEKGLHRLCEAYAALRGRGALAGCRVELAGYLGHEHAGWWRSVEKANAGRGLAGDVRYRGELALDDKVAFLQALDLFVVPAEYDDPKGLSLIEAMACGTPVVAPRRGTYTELLERTGGGVLVEPDDAGGLEQALAALAADPARRVELGRRAAEGVRAHYSTDEMAARALDVYARLARQASPAATAAQPTL